MALYYPHAVIRTAHGGSGAPGAARPLGSRSGSTQALMLGMTMRGATTSGSGPGAVALAHLAWWRHWRALRVLHAALLASSGYCAPRVLARTVRPARVRPASTLASHHCIGEHSSKPSLHRRALQPVQRMQAACARRAWRVRCGPRPGHASRARRGSCSRPAPSGRS
jgi:hypothetical protein